MFCPSESSHREKRSYFPTEFATTTTGVRLWILCGGGSRGPPPTNKPYCCLPLVVDCNYGLLYACRLCGNVKVFQNDCTFDMPLLLSDYHHSETYHFGSQNGPFLLTKWAVLRSKRTVSQRQMVCNRLKPTQYKGRARHSII